MKKVIFLPLFIFLLTFTGCDSGSIFGPSDEEIALKQKELDQVKELKQKELNATFAIKEKELNLKEKEILQNKELKQQEAQLVLAQKQAELDNKKDIEIEKIKSDIEKEKIRIEKERIKAQNREKRLQFELEALQKEKDKQLQFYAMLLTGVIILLISIAIFIYFNNKRKDKLKAYQDNMEKYFRTKENEAKLQIANKILDTIAQGNLNAQTEAKLIASLNGSTPKNEEIKPQLENNKFDEVVDLEILDEEIKKEQENKSK